MREAHDLALHEVDEATGRGDEQVASLLDGLDLRLEPGSTHDDHGALPGHGADLLGDVLDLARELARGGDDEREGPGLSLGASCPLGVRRVRLGDALQGGQGESAGLARAGLRARKHVAPGEDGGDGAGLHRRGGVEAKCLDTGKDVLVKPELGK